MNKLRQKSIVLLMGIIALGFSSDQTFDENIPDGNATYRTVENKAFKVGEKLNYLVHYGFINAGVARLEVKKPDRKFKGRELIHVIGTGRSARTFDWFFKVRDRYESYMDEEGLFPWLFIRNVNEGGYEIHQTYKFFQNTKVVETQKGERHEVPFGVQDMISSAMYARTLDFDQFNVDDTLAVMSFVDDELYKLMIRYKGKEKIRVKSGVYYCHKFNPVVQQGRVFKDSEELSVWITADENKIPILAKADVLVGSIKVELTSYSGLANPLAKIK